MTDYSKLLAKIDAIKAETLRDAITPLRLGLILEEMLGRFSVVPPATPDSAWYDFDLWRRAISYGDTDGSDRYVLTGLTHTAAANKINLSASMLNMRTGAVHPAALQPLLPVSETAAGLMTPEMLRKLNSASTGSGDVDLSNYYTIDQADKNFLTSEKIFALSLKAGAFSAATYNPAVKALQVNIPTKLSHLDNDRDFVDSSVIAGFAKESDVNNALSLKLDKATFDDLFVKEPDGKGGYRIQAKYALYTNSWMSCLGANPDAGTVALGATTLGGLNNVVAAADESSAAAKVLVREAGASSWTLKSLSDIVGLDTTALAAYLSNNHYAKISDIPSLADYLKKTEASQLYQPIGDYALSSALTSAINTLNTAIGAKLDAATFDDLFVKEPDGKGGYRIQAKYALYTNSWMSCLGANPDAGTVALGATTLGGLNNVVAAADEVSAAAMVLVREAGASSWSLKSLSDIVGLDTTALATYLSNNHYAKTSDIPSLAEYATRTWVQQQGYLTEHQPLTDYLKKTEAASLYQPIGDYATNSALNSAVSSLNTAIGKKLDAATFDDLFVKESDGNGGYRIKARYALYSNQYLSCLGNNPDAGTVALGATTLGGLNNVVAAADEATAAAKVLVREAGASSWTLKNLSDIVGLDTAALATYLSNNGYAKTSDIPSLTGYATQQWVQLQGYLTEHQSLADYATKAWVEGKGYLTAITKAQVEAVLTGDITTHTHSQYLTSTLAAQTYQPKGDYALTSALNSAVSTLNTAIGKKLDSATFDDLFVKESDGNGGYRIRAKYAFYSDLYISCLGNNPGAGTTTGGGVDLDAVQEYLQQQGYATQDWVRAQGYVSSLSNYYTKAEVDAKVKYLPTYYGSRPTTANVNFGNAAGLYTFLASSSMTTAKPANDGHILHLEWDNSLSWAAQVAVPCSGGTGMQWRYQASSSAWQGWRTLLDSENYAGVLNGKYVTLDTAQDISGEKHFTSGNTVVDGQLRIDGASTSFTSLPKIKLHIPGINWAQFVINTDGKVHLLSGGATAFNSYLSLTASSFVRYGGTSSQFLKADGSVDGNTYLTTHQPLNYINVQDTRDAATNTSADRRLTAHFKANGSIGLSDGGLYAGLLHFQPWTDAGGGSAYELGFTVNGNLWLRSGAIGSAWGAWRKILDTNNYASVLNDTYVTLSTAQTITGQKTFTNYIRFEKAIMFKEASSTTGIYFAPGTSGELVFNTHSNYSYSGRIGHISYAGALTMNSFVKAGGTASQYLMADGSVRGETYFRHGAGAIPTAYVDLTTYTSGASGYANYQSGAYQVPRTGYSELLVNLAINGGSTSALQFWTSYKDTDALKFRKTVDANRVSGPWRTIVTELNIGSYALTPSNYTSTLDGRYVNVSGDTMTGDLLFGDSGTGVRQIRFLCGANDYGRIAVGATATSAGWLEIATADDGNEPIYARQYSGTYATIARTATLLDASGNTAFPGRVNASYFTANSTTLCTNLNADLLDGVHLSDIRGVGYAMQDTIIDASSLDVNTWYPVVIPIGARNNTRIEVLVALDSGTKPSWSTHASGFSVRVVWEVNGHGWGTTPINRTIYASDYAFTATAPVRGIGQMSNSSLEYVFVRGGGKYRFRTSNGAVPTLQSSTYTQNSQSISPTTTAPAAIVRNNALITDNVASATKLQTARTIWGQSFDGAANVSGNMTGVGEIHFANSGAPYINDHGNVIIGSNGNWAVYNSSIGIVLQTLNSGNVGIGTTAPSYKLHAVGDIMAEGWVRTTGAHGWYNQTYAGGWYMDGAAWVKAWQKPVYIAYTAGEGANSFGVGLRCYHASHTSVEVQGGSYTMGLGCHSNGTWYWWRGTSAGKGYVMQYDGTTWAFNGVIKTSTGMYSDGYMSCLGKNDGSDERLKTIIGDVTLPIDVILGAPAVRFTWNANAGAVMAGKVAVGTVAQYWLEHLTEVVGTMPTGYYGVNYGALDWVAIHSVAKYAKTEIELLKEENQKLKERVAALERRLAA